VSVDDGQEELLKEKLPGPYTFIVKNKAVPRVVTGGLDTLGVRVPDYGLVRELIREADTPIVTTSANISGEKTPCSIHEIPYSVLEQVGFVIDAGACKLGRPSEIIDLATGEKLR
jgi:L-threonylcarbamoyladenylate synthase